MSKEKYITLSAVRKQVEAKIKRNKRIKKKLRKAVKEVNSIDDIYVIRFNLNSDNWASRIERLYKIQYESLGIKYVPLESKRGRHAVFDKDKNDIVSKFRKSGIVKFRTITLNTVRTPENESRVEIITKVYQDWKDEMVGWIGNQDARLSNDEKKISKIKYHIVTDSDSAESSLAKKVLDDLNDGKSFNVMKYENGEIDAAVHDIIVLDFS